MRVPRSAVDILARMLAMPLAATSLASAPAAARADFYKGKTIDLVISTGAGGGLEICRDNRDQLAPHSRQARRQSISQAGISSRPPFCAPKSGGRVSTFRVGWQRLPRTAMA
jgi:hypothetical protein